MRAYCVYARPLLKYKNKRFFEEKSIISKNEENVLFQQICYDKPRVIDEEYCHNLKITFLDLDKAKSKKIIDIKTDTSIVKFNYGIFSIWNWSDEKNEITGTIEILDWGKEEVQLKENILINDIRRNRKRVLQGRRKFIKRKDLNF